MADSVVSDGVSKTVLSPGSGPEVKKGNTITVHCTGILAESNKKFWRFANLLLLVQYGSSLEAHLTRTREWPNPNPNPKPNPKPNPNPNPNHNPNTLTLTLTLKTILARCASGLDPTSGPMHEEEEEEEECICACFMR